LGEKTAPRQACAMALRYARVNVKNLNSGLQILKKQFPTSEPN